MDMTEKMTVLLTVDTMQLPEGWMCPVQNQSESDTKVFLQYHNIRFLLIHSIFTLSTTADGNFLKGMFLQFLLMG